MIIDNLFKIAEVFDVMGWWAETGRNKFPWTHVVAFLYLPIPDSNGDQERDFSSATWTDDILRTDQKDCTFEKKGLLHLNREFEDEHVGIIDIDEKHKKIANDAIRLMDEAALIRLKEDRRGKPTDEEEKAAEAEYEKNLPDDESVDIDWDALDSDDEGKD